MVSFGFFFQWHIIIFVSYWIPKHLVEDQWYYLIHNKGDIKRNSVTRVRKYFHGVCSLSPYIYIYIYIYIFNTFQDFFVQAFKIVVDPWKFTMLLLYILWPIFMISGSNEQLQQQLEYTLLKTDCHSWWISKMQSVHEDALEERYAIKFCFKLGKRVRVRVTMLRF